MHHHISVFARSETTYPSSTRTLRLWQLIPLLVVFAIPTMRAGFVETFDNGSNNGDWHLTVNPATIEPDGGNPGPYLHATATPPFPPGMFRSTPTLPTSSVISLKKESAHLPST